VRTYYGNYTRDLSTATSPSFYTFRGIWH